jgi:hypothetical protein
MTMMSKSPRSVHPLLYVMCLEYLLLQHSSPTAQHIERTTPHPYVHREPSYAINSDKSYYIKSATP